MDPVLIWKAGTSVYNDNPYVFVSSPRQAVLWMANQDAPFQVRYLYDATTFLRLWSLLPHRMDHEPYWDAQYQRIAETKPVTINAKKCCGKKLPRYIHVGNNFMVYCQTCGWFVSTFTGSKDDITQRWERSLTPREIISTDWSSCMMLYRQLNAHTKKITELAIQSNSRITTG